MSEESTKKGFETGLLSVGGTDTQCDHDRSSKSVVAQIANREKEPSRVCKGCHQEIPKYADAKSSENGLRRRGSGLQGGQPADMQQLSLVGHPLQ